MGKARAVEFAVLSVALALWAAAPGLAQTDAPGPKTGDLGVGVAIGQPMGATAKYWARKALAFDGGAGESDSHAAIYGDLLLNAWDVLPQPRKGKLGVYFSVGPRLEFATDTEFALRTLGGLSYWLADHPVEFFAEAGPLFRLTQGGDVSADGAFGVRFYFNVQR